MRVMRAARSRSGWRTPRVIYRRRPRWARALAPALFARPPQGQAHLLATVWFGANDACISTERTHVPLREFEANLETIVQQAR